MPLTNPDDRAPPPSDRPVGPPPVPRAARLALAVVAAGALACVLAAIPSPLFDLDRHSVPKELVLHVAAGAAGALALAGGRRLPLTVTDLLLAAWLLLGSLSALAAPNPWLAGRALAVQISGAVVFWTARRLAAAGLAPRLLAAMGFAVVLAAATALAQAYGLAVPFAAETRVPGGTFGNRNFMAHLLAVGLPVLALAAVQARTRRRFAAAALGLALVGAALLLSRTRAAWLAVAVSAAVGLGAALLSPALRRTPAVTRRLLLLAAAAVLGVALGAALPNELDWRSRSPYLETARSVVNYRSGSGRGRLIQYRNTLGMALDHPFLGVGPGNWPVVYPLYASRRDPSMGARGLMPTNPWPSSDWVGFLVEWGGAAFLCLVGVAGGLAAAGWGRLRAGDRDAALGGVALLAAVASAVVVGAFDAVLHLATPTLVFWAVAGTLAAGGRPVRTLPLSKGRRRAAVVSCLVLCLGGAARSAGQAGAVLAAGAGWRIGDLEEAARWDPGNYRVRLLLAQHWARRGRCDKARPHAEAAAGLYPYLTEPRRLLAACGARRPD